MEDGKVLVGFDGASGSGKTTLINELAGILISEGHSVGVVPEVARIVFERYRDEYGFRSLQELRASPLIAEYQKEVLDIHCTLEEEMMKKHDVVLCDRTLFGNAFFTLYFVRDDRALREYFEKLEGIIEERKKNLGRVYDAVVITSPLPESVDIDDGFRTVDLGYRFAQDFTIKNLAKANVDKVVELDTPNIEARIAKVGEIMYGMLLMKIL